MISPGWWRRASREILSRLTEGAHLYSFDQDADAERNVVANENFTFVCSNFRFLKNWMRYYGVDGLDGLLADLGVSSHHFDDEMYRNVGKHFRISIGKPIPWQTFDKSKSATEWAQYVEDRVYEL